MRPPMNSVAASKAQAVLRFVLAFLCAGSLSGQPAPAREVSDQDEYQFNINPHHPLLDQLNMFGNFGCLQGADDTKYRFGWPGLDFRANAWLQLWGGLDAYYTDNDQTADQLELRPFAGVKLFVPNRAKIVLYNFTRYEYRDFENLDSQDWSGYSRVRSRFGGQVPLASAGRAWQPKTFYVLADVEPFYRFDRSEWDPVRVRGGLGCILNARVRVELIYTAQFTRSSPGRSLEYYNNIVELNVRIGLKQGILGRLFNPGD